jgi:succinyl-diaminopimelate desuccinylase
VRLALQAVRKVTGVRTLPGGFVATSDMRYLQEAGIDTVILGPGGLNQAHAVDEFVKVDEIITAAKIYAQIILDLPHTLRSH